MSHPVTPLLIADWRGRSELRCLCGRPARKVRDSKPLRPGVLRWRHAQQGRSWFPAGPHRTRIVLRPEIAAARAANPAPIPFADVWGGSPR